MNSAIIVAAGKGLRMQADQRKQFIDLAGLPILTHTLRVFDVCSAIDQSILVLPAEEMPYCRKHILGPVDWHKKITLVPGGERRQDSVFNGLASITDDRGIVLIHDGVRPLVTTDIIDACIRGAEKWGGCIPAVAPVDTPKRVDGSGMITGTIDRSGLRMAQTPQAFQLPIIRKAHQQAIQEGWEATDDASLVERMGGGVRTVPGDYENLKITTPHDLVLARTILSRRLGVEDGP